MIPETPSPELRSPVVEIAGLTKRYLTGFWLNQTITSLEDVTLDVSAGETFGLLGPNGAGKTTLLKLLLGIARPTAGWGRVLGRPLGDRTVRGRVGYLPESAYFYDHLTGWEYLHYSAQLLGLTGRSAQRQVTELLDWVGLSQTAARQKLMRQYSKGMLQRVGMAQALLNDPDVVFLDEPMSGLDPLGRYQIREIILDLKRRGKTIFFNSHILSDVEQVCDRVAILARGQLLCVGALDALLGNTEVYQVTGVGGSAEIVDQWLQPVEHQGEHWSGQLHQAPEAFLAAIAPTGGRVLRLVMARPSLESFFVQTLRDHNIQPS